MADHRTTIIIGAGLSGLVVAHRIKRHNPGHRLLLIDKNSQAGGVIKSFSEDGYLGECGPHGFLDNCVESRELLAETGLDKECVKASLQTHVRYVCRNGKLLMIPQSPLKIIKAPLLSWPDKFRVLGDLFKKPLGGEPTVAKWATYRFGKAILPYVDAVFTGTYAGDYNALKIDAVMPGVRELERRYGSVIRGALAKARQAKKQKERGEKLQMPSMTSFPGGMQRLPDRLAELLDESELRLNTGVTSISKTTSGWSVHCDSTSLSCDNLVLALPVNDALRLLAGIDPAATAKQVPEAWITSILFGFHQAGLPPGFGFLTPEIEQRFSLGTLFSSNMFADRAPAGSILFETLVGGRRHPERFELDDDSLITQALADVRELLELPKEPAFTKVLRPAGGIPQLEKNYPELLAWRNELVQSNKGLYICGFGWEGIGLNDMIKKACSAAAKLNGGMVQFQSQAEVKKVYF